MSSDWISITSCNWATSNNAATRGRTFWKKIFKDCEKICLVEKEIFTTMGWACSNKDAVSHFSRCLLRLLYSKLVKSDSLAFFQWNNKSVKCTVPFPWLLHQQLCVKSWTAFEFQRQAGLKPLYEDKRCRSLKSQTKKISINI